MPLDREQLYAPVQTPAQGLLSLLSLKNIGQNPGQLSSVIRPTMEIVEWLLSRDQEILIGNRNYPAASNVFATTQDASSGDLGFPIPDNETWFVWSSSVQLVMQNAADNISGSIGIGWAKSLGGASPADQVDLYTSGMIAHTGAKIVTVGGPVRMFMPPRWQPFSTMGLVQVDPVGVDAVMHYKATITRLKI